MREQRNHVWNKTLWRQVDHEPDLKFCHEWKMETAVDDCTQHTSTTSSLETKKSKNKHITENRTTKCYQNKSLGWNPDRFMAL